jgi:hypothetical protein
MRYEVPCLTEHGSATVRTLTGEMTVSWDGAIIGLIGARGNSSGESEIGLSEPTGSGGETIGETAVD